MIHTQPDARPQSDVVPQSGFKPLFAPSRAWTKAAKPVLLTFDDGPCVSTTPIVLDVLKSYGIRALFFIVGRRLEDVDNRNLLIRIIAEGHSAGNHSYTHPDLGTASAERIRWEIEETQRQLEVFGVQERLFRPPYGFVNEMIADAVRSLNLWGVGWCADTSDWKQEYKPDGWIANGCTRIQQNEENIVLLHDIHPTTAAGLERFIKLLLQSGYTFPSLFCESVADFDSSHHTWVPSFKGWEMIQTLRLFRPLTRAVQKSSEIEH